MAMLAAPELAAMNFAAYPPHARQVAVASVALLDRLPRLFAAVLLREIASYDWKFPAERDSLDAQLDLLRRLNAADLQTRMKDFAAVRLSPELQRSDLAAAPASYLERVTAWLWSSGQMDAFRQAADSYTSYIGHAAPTSRPAMERLGIVIVGQGSHPGPVPYKLFRKLRPHGLYLTRIQPGDGVRILLDAAARRAGTLQPAPGSGYRHWYIDGGAGLSTPGLTMVSFAGLQHPLKLLLARVQREIDSGSTGPEGLRSTLAQMRPEDVGLGAAGRDAVLDHFCMSVLTEGSGTQIFTTTFVQWAARECLRRAQPETLVLRYAPRRALQPMNVMLSHVDADQLDPDGSLIDADMGAYYTWLNMNRLSGADRMSFLAWHEDAGEAVAIGPGLPQGTSSDDALNMQQVLALLG
jgi:hypothetical protein